MRLVFIVFLSMFSFVAQATELKPLELVYADLLLKQDNVSVKLAAASIAKEKIQTQTLLDLVLFTLDASLSGDISIHEDSQSWLLKALAHSKNGRYTAYVKQLAAKQYKGKLAEHIKYAHRYLAKQKFDISYQPTHDISDYFVKALAQAREQVSQKHYSFLFSVKHEMPLQEVFEHAGFPQAVQVGLKRTRNRWIGFLVTNEMRLELIYPQFGVARFDKVGSRHWKLDFIKPDLDYLLANPGQLARIFDYQDVRSTRMSMRELFNLDTVPATALDGLAKLVYRFKDTEDKQLADAVAYIIKTLAKHDIGRFQQFFRDVAESAQNGKVRNYSEEYIQRRITGEQFTLSD